jgi:peptidoglycan/xylan/chitin deacetylase (PgdA/CDA1 family)
VAGIAVVPTVLILGYHNIVPDGTPAALAQARLAIPAAEFARQMSYLVRRYTMVSLDLPAAPNEGQGALITFDDGYRSVLTLAAPLLARSKIPAYVFVNPAYVGSWNHRDKLLGLALYGSERCKDELARIFAAPAHFERHRLCSYLRTALWRELRERGESVLEQIDQMFERHADDRVRNEIEPCRLLAWDELMMLREQGVRIGNHTLHHLELDILPRSSARFQIRSAQQQIREHLQVEEPVISYPRGKISDAVVEEAASAGYVWGLTASPGIVSSSLPTLKAPRVMVSPPDTVRMLRWKSSRFRLWARRRQAVEILRRARLYAMSLPRRSLKGEI